MQVLIKVESTSNIVVDLSGAELEVFSRILGKMKFCESRYGLENTVLVESANIKAKDMFKLELSDISVYPIPEYEEAKAAHDERQAAKAEADRVKRADTIYTCFLDAEVLSDDSALELYRKTFIAVATGAGFLYNSEAKSLGSVIADVDLKTLTGDYTSYSGDLTTLTLDANGGHTKTNI